MSFDKQKNWNQYAFQLRTRFCNGDLVYVVPLTDNFDF